MQAEVAVHNTLFPGSQRRPNNTHVPPIRCAHDGTINNTYASVLPIVFADTQRLRHTAAGGRNPSPALNMQVKTKHTPVSTTRDHRRSDQAAPNAPLASLTAREYQSQAPGTVTKSKRRLVKRWQSRVGGGNRQRARPGTSTPTNVLPLR